MSNLFSGKNKKNIIILLSAENAQRVVKVKIFDKFSLHVALLSASAFSSFLSSSLIGVYGKEKSVLFSKSFLEF